MKFNKTAHKRKILKKIESKTKRWYKYELYSWILTIPYLTQVFCEIITLFFSIDKLFIIEKQMAKNILKFVTSF